MLLKQITSALLLSFHGSATQLCILPFFAVHPETLPSPPQGTLCSAVLVSSLFTVAEEYSKKPLSRDCLLLCESQNKDTCSLTCVILPKLSLLLLYPMIGSLNLPVMPFSLRFLVLFSTLRWVCFYCIPCFPSLLSYPLKNMSCCGI